MQQEEYEAPSTEKAAPFDDFQDYSSSKKNQLTLTLNLPEMY